MRLGEAVQAHDGQRAEVQAAADPRSGVRMRLPVSGGPPAGRVPSHRDAVQLDGAGVDEQPAAIADPAGARGDDSDGTRPLVEVRESVAAPAALGDVPGESHAGQYGSPAAEK